MVPHTELLPKSETTPSCNDSVASAVDRLHRHTATPQRATCLRKEDLLYVGFTGLTDYWRAVIDL